MRELPHRMIVADDGYARDIDTLLDFEEPEMLVLVSSARRRPAHLPNTVWYSRRPLVQCLPGVGLVHLRCTSSPLWQPEALSIQQLDAVLPPCEGDCVLVAIAALLGWTRPRCPLEDPAVEAFVRAADHIAADELEPAAELLGLVTGAWPEWRPAWLLAHRVLQRLGHRRGARMCLSRAAGMPSWVDQTAWLLKVA